MCVVCVCVYVHEARTRTLLKHILYNSCETASHAGWIFFSHHTCAAILSPYMSKHSLVRARPHPATAKDVSRACALESLFRFRNVHIRYRCSLIDRCACGGTHMCTRAEMYRCKAPKRGEVCARACGSVGCFGDESDILRCFVHTVQAICKPYQNNAVHKKKTPPQKKPKRRRVFKVSHPSLYQPLRVKNKHGYATLPCVCTPYSICN